MNGDEISYGLKVVEIGLIAGVKFLFAPFEAERQGFDFWQSFAWCTAGGIAGILVFAFAGTIISKWWRHIGALVKSVFVRKPAAVLERKPRKKFTRTKKMIVRIKMKFGLWGIAFVTPCIISIPIGTIVSIHFFRNKKKVLIYLAASLLFWSALLNGLAQLLKLSQYIPH